jgi:hypothetical protein
LRRSPPLRSRWSKVKIRHLPGKLETCFDDAMLKVMVFAGLAAALLGVFYGWYRLRGVVRDTSLPTWRKGNLKSRFVRRNCSGPHVDTNLYGA